MAENETKPKYERRDGRVQAKFWITPEAKQALENAAAADGITMSEVVETWALDLR